jgi:hypothetical protein
MVWADLGSVLALLLPAGGWVEWFGTTSFLGASFWWAAQLRSCSLV